MTVTRFVFLIFFLGLIPQLSAQAKYLKNYEGSFLSILGEDDYVVPCQIQIERLEALFRESGKENYRIRVLPGAGHGLEHGPRVRDLGYNRTLRTRPYYFKYDRVAYGAIEEVVDFLARYSIVDF